jgi:hypothetical protein
MLVVSYSSGKKVPVLWGSLGKANINHFVSYSAAGIGGTPTEI